MRELITKQIIPCVGEWNARFKDNDTGEVSDYPVACWTFCIDHFEHIIGLIAEEGFDDLVTVNESLCDNEEFLGYFKLTNG